PDFRHALLREAAYDQLLASERRRIHKAAAVAAEERGANPTVVAHHAERAGLDDDALVAWLAGARAAAGLARVDAPTAYRRAVELWDRVPDADARTGTTRQALLREAADASLAVGETDLGAGFAEQAFAASDATDDPHGWAELALTLSELRWEQGRMADADALLDEVAVLLDPSSPSAHLAWLHERRSFHALVRGEGDEALELGRTAVELAIAAGDPGVELYSLSGLGFALAIHGDVPGGIEVLLDARDRSHDAGLV
ncbi:hypothetical protein B7486_67290, partial [cyanobacterium TDX16]